MLGNRIKALEVGRVNGIENMGGLGLPEKSGLGGSPAVYGLGGSPTVRCSQLVELRVMGGWRGEIGDGIFFILIIHIYIFFIFFFR